MYNINKKMSESAKKIYRILITFISFTFDPILKPLIHNLELLVKAGTRRLI